MEQFFDHLDTSAILYYNPFVGRSRLVDRAALEVSSNLLFKGGVLMVALWGFWFRLQEPEEARRNRTRILTTLLAMFAVLAVARFLAHSLPYRLRPLYRTDIFQSPQGFTAADLNSLELGSSFPSDHAALFMCLASGIYLLSPRWGWAAFVYVLLVICLPRMYVGYHYLTDILCGAALGVIGTALAHRLAERTTLGKALLARILSWSEVRPGWFYAGFFLLSFEIVELFDSVRYLLRFRGLLG
jgi:undecaprenyl-diphosphatase